MINALQEHGEGDDTGGFGKGCSLYQTLRPSVTDRNRRKAMLLLSDHGFEIASQHIETESSDHLAGVGRCGVSTEPFFEPFDRIIAG